MSSSGVFSYVAYGLRIHSELPLPELLSGPPDERPPDVSVWLDRDSRPARGAGACRVPHGITPTEARFCWESVGSFVVRRGEEVAASPAPGAEDRAVRGAVLGTVMAMLLHQRGLLLLHGSAVAVEGMAAVILGGKGMGKSSLAMALHQRGHSLLADDVVVLCVGGDSVVVRPALPRVKLCPDTIRSFGVVPEELPVASPEDGKRFMALERGFSQTPLPLRRVYVLATDSEPAAGSLSARAAFMELLRYSTAAPFLAPTNTSRLHFDQCARVVEAATVRRLNRRHRLPELPDLARRLEEDITCA